ncbi:MAG: transcriptional regulator DtxR family [Herbinix sp.]|jgi:Mn-dependent DtxR family transcriptional regulator|nr:transcriptional regulator DtxR family [Herbinix sp.]
MYESGENYLETILVLSRRGGSVRSIDIARELNFSKPSVSRAVGILKEDGFIVTDEDGSIKLTEKGKDKANNVYERHQLLTAFLMETAGVSPEIAEDDACRIEHIISEDTFKGIKKYLQSHKEK